MQMHFSINTLPYRGLSALSSSPEVFFSLRHNFVLSYATLCISHWFVGIGDRHLNNCLVSQKDARCVAIDFGHSFGTATQFLPVPELFPFRLTPHLVSMMQPLEQTGFLRESMIHVVRALRKNHSILLATMEVFVLEPSIDWLELARKQNKNIHASTTQRICNDVTNKYELNRLNAEYNGPQLTKLPSERPVQPPIMLAHTHKNIPTPSEGGPADFTPSAVKASPTTKKKSANLTQPVSVNTQKHNCHDSVERLTHPADYKYKLRHHLVGFRKVDEDSWFPRQKVSLARKKLEGANPAAITEEELQTGIISSSVALKEILKVARGDAEHNTRARLPDTNLTPEKQVDCLLDQATDYHLLGMSWDGWEPWV
uniref:Non-specific serine/threonine protein kinase n=1 Tax=Timema genevievae TaxID=629358 RepID=A0A7R9K892_TIMGE|nr:unnamed protein product [Timema genevievae]